MGPSVVAAGQPSAIDAGGNAPAAAAPATADAAPASGPSPPASAAAPEGPAEGDDEDDDADEDEDDGANGGSEEGSETAGDAGDEDGAGDAPPPQEDLEDDNGGALPPEDDAASDEQAMGSDDDVSGDDDTGDDDSDGGTDDDGEGTGARRRLLDSSGASEYVPSASLWLENVEFARNVVEAPDLGSGDDGQVSQLRTTGAAPAAVFSNQAHLFFEELSQDTVVPNALSEEAFASGGFLSEESSWFQATQAVCSPSSVAGDPAPVTTLPIRCCAQTSKVGRRSG